MNDTKALLQKISALRLRLDEAQRLANPTTGGRGAATLEEQVQHGGWHNTLIASALESVQEEKQVERFPLPPRLTARAARVLKQGRELLHELRALADDTILPADPFDPITSLHMETCAMLEAVLRGAATLPAEISAQLRLSQGLDASLETVRERLAVLHAAIARRRQDTELLEGFADLLTRLAAGQKVQPRGFQVLADKIVRDARLNLPLRFFESPATDPARFVAAHCLTVAQVLARLVVHEPYDAADLEEMIIAALAHDVGMVRMPVDLLAHAGAWTDEQRRLMERHTSTGAAILSRALPASSMAVQAAEDHHERVDGTGYPAGKRGEQITDFVKLLAVCDVYAALCAARPYRSAEDTRTALTDVLLLADQGALDKNQAERLLRLSFFPVGSIVELSDGAIAMVIATQGGPQGLLHPAKPIVSVLQEPQGRALAMPSVLDLLHEENRCVLRALPAEDRKRALGTRYPALV